LKNTDLRANKKVIKAFCRMAEAAGHKVGSRAGTSITFALLLFLVCAVVGSVVLVSGTAAAGRLSEIADYDQRYYSVTSAAELLADKLDGYSVTVVQESKEEYVSTATYTDTDSDGVVDTRTMSAYTKSGETVYSSRIEGKDGEAQIALGQSLLRDVAMYLVYGNADSASLPAASSKAAYDANYPGLTSDKVLSPMTITHTVGDGISADALAVDAAITINPSGEVTIKLSNTNGDKKYNLTMILNTDIVRTNPVTTDINPSDPDNLIKTVTSAKNTTFTWTVKDIY